MWTLQFTPQELELLEKALLKFRMSNTLNLVEFERLEKLIEQVSDATHAAHK